ncbi:MAG TPA: 5-deoxy-glucuronate isomerase [Vicinamibacterales bacterium]|nr:5-deoxy-glucuronate isomerase [Vicinamibacterales bacterium]
MSSMLRDTLYRLPRQPGLQLLQRRGEGGARELTTWRLRLTAGADHRYTAVDEESVLVVQRGAASVTVGGQTFGVNRKDVFEQPASAVYVPPNELLTIVAASDFESILVSTPAAAHGSARHVTPAEVRVNARGRGNYAREVHDIFVTDPVAQRIMVGETFNPAGHWSSFPPHKHDGKDGEPILEEVYYFRIDPPQGFGQQLLYTADGECASHVVRDGDAVLLPYGYHPVSSPPGYRLYYLWAMAGAERKLALHEDPDHRWIHEATPPPAEGKR